VALACLVSVVSSLNAALGFARSLEEQSDLMVQRLPQTTSAGAPRRLSARTRARDRRGVPALLHAPFVYPLGDADAVTLHNSDLDRCAAFVAASALLNRVLMTDLHVRTQPERWRVPERQPGGLLAQALAGRAGGAAVRRGLRGAFGLQMRCCRRVCVG
jgi:hypothetical protein